MAYGRSRRLSASSSLETTRSQSVGMVMSVPAGGMMVERLDHWEDNEASHCQVSLFFEFFELFERACADRGISRLRLLLRREATAPG